METKNIYLIWAHPRRDSLTAQVVKEIQQQAEDQQITVDTLDLYRMDFDPVLRMQDEPDWANPHKTYAPEVHKLFAQMQGHDTAVIVFPVWWYSFPAILKGYIDRVWNNGLVYGEGGALPFKKIRWVALVGGAEDKFELYGWRKNMSDYLINVAGYLGVTDVDVTYLYNTIGVEEDIDNREEHYQALFTQSREMVKTL
ncbi:NAD(P)H oxidoreductase [Pseudocitrobacter cyperus]|uniref:NAD(P)H oxidoreductase n=1 Tax=Pseudocitrobacter cyperus TaxID=3112843 RepID=A0ABV0HGV1_9ENTR